MGERTTVAAISQIGVEVTPGTAVPATKILSSIEITGGIKNESEVFTPAGQKYPSFVVPGREWTEWKIGGRVTYGELPYILSGMLCATTASSDTSLGKKWVFAPALAAEDTIKTLTLEQGSATRAHNVAYWIPTELGFKFSRKGVEYEGAAIGQALGDGFTLTTGTTAVEDPPVPVLGSQVSVSFADSWAGLAGASAATRVLEANWKIGDRFNPLWVLDASKTSYVAHVEKRPAVSGNIIMEADAAGMGYLTLMRAATRKWMRISAVGATIESGKTYLFQIDGCYNISAATPFEDRDGVYAIGWTFQPVYDATATKTFEITVRNKLAAL